MSAVLLEVLRIDLLTAALCAGLLVIVLCIGLAAEPERKIVLAFRRERRR